VAGVSAALDGSYVVRFLDGLIETSTDVVDRTHLEVVRDHMRAEAVDFDIDALMTTMIPEPEFHYYGDGTKRSVIGYDDVRNHYLAGFQQAHDSQQTRLTLVIAGEAGVVMEGTFQLLGSRAAAVFPAVATLIDTGRPSILTKEFAVVIPFRDARMVGENVYLNGPITANDLAYI
jgi:hypothetical protein